MPSGLLLCAMRSLLQRLVERATPPQALQLVSSLFARPNDLSHLESSDKGSPGECACDLEFVRMGPQA